MRVDPYQYQQSQMLWKSRCNWDSIFNVVPEFKKWCYEPIAWHQNWVRSRPTIFLPKWKGNLWKTKFFTPWPPARKRRDASGWVQQVKLLVRMGQQMPCWQKVAAGPFWPCFAYPKLGDAGRTQVASKIRRCWKKLGGHKNPRPCRLSTPPCHTYSEPSVHEDSPGSI